MPGRPRLVLDQPDPAVCLIFQLAPGKTVPGKLLHYPAPVQRVPELHSLQGDTACDLHVAEPGGNAEVRDRVPLRQALVARQSRWSPPQRAIFRETGQVVQHLGSVADEPFHLGVLPCRRRHGARQGGAVPHVTAGVGLSDQRGQETGLDARPRVGWRDRPGPVLPTLG